MAAVLLAVIFDPLGRFDAKKLLHLWIRRYAVAVTLQSAALVFGLPLVLAVCPENHQLFRTSFALIGSGGYVVSQLILAHITVLRRRVVASANAAKRATWMLRLSILTGGLNCVAIALMGVVPRSALNVA